ncbi:COMM domain-containing protein 5 [Cimex lectularius]|uniref:COMM domain-containing protein 5 n=1 Tax=Cimex lectularius TaxID=79782 RepID=A0A8I6S150_CIMLE|nr:COMM domain-containing protein 5 [Cimex lectularius]
MSESAVNTLEKVNWRVNVIISSRDLSKVLEPIVYLELVMADGKIESLEVPVSKFHTLRQNVALLLKEIDTVNRKGSNILRLIGPSQFS